MARPCVILFKEDKNIYRKFMVTQNGLTCRAPPKPHPDLSLIVVQVSRPVKAVDRLLQGTLGDV
jgi:hypothetical protein